MQTIKRLIYYFIIRPLLNVINICTRKRKNCVFFVPHHNCKHDHYDVINYESDNTLCLLNHMLRQHTFDGYTFYIVHYDKTKEASYYEYCKSINQLITCKFLYAPKTERPILKHLLAFYHCQYAFCSDVYYDFTTKQKNQTVTSLGYFTPFKSDDRHFSDAQFDAYRRFYNKSYNYQITTSKISSQIQCADKGIYWNRHQVLGFPRNDIFYQSSTHNFKKQLENIKNFSIRKVVLYTPTYRDYETSVSEKRSIFGFELNSYAMQELASILEKHEAILIYKLHPWQEQTCIVEGEWKRLMNYRDIPFLCNLYAIMAETDILITDYTSTYFDFLHRNCPVIFNFYDVDKYEAHRGLSYQPVDCIAAGHIISNAQQLIDALQDTLSGKDPFKAKRFEIHRLFNYQHDGNSATRICREILNK